MTFVDKALRWSPLQWMARRLVGSKLSVLGFHGVDDPLQFARLMDHVRETGTPVSVEQVVDASQGGGELPPRACLVTFDDGERSVLEYGLPILAERGIPAVTFVVPSLLSTETDFWWSAAADLVAAGGVLTGYEGLDGEGVVRFLKTVPNEDRLQALEDLEISAGRPPAPRLQLTPEDLLRLRDGSVAIGNHTWSHPCLNRCEPADVRREIGEGHRVLEQILGEPPRWFAYPNGDWDPVAEQTLRELGYEVAFLFDHLHASPPFDPMKVSRLRVNSDTSTDRFMAITSGLHPRIHRMRGRN